MDGATPFDVFLSHSSSDDRVVRRLHNLLETYRPPRRRGAPRPRRLKVFHYRYDHRLSDSLTAALVDQIGQCRHLVVAASEAAANAPLVEFEASHFLATRDTGHVHIALVGDALPSALPVTLRKRLTDPIYADLRCGNCSWLRWFLFERRRFRRALIPLLARLYGERPDDLVRRDRQRARLRYLAASIPFVAVAAALGGLMLRSPGHAWMPTAVKGLDVADAAFLVDASGVETIRVLLSGVMRPGGEEIRVTRHVVVDLDTAGRVTGTLAYSDRNGGVRPEFEPERRFGPLGSLAGERDTLLEVGSRRHGLTRNQVPVFLFRQSGFSIDEQIRSLAPGLWPRIDDDEDLVANIAAAAGEHAPAGYPTWQSFKLPGHRVLTFVRIALAPPVYGEQTIGSLPLISSDLGRTWHAGQRSLIVASGVTSVATSPATDGIVYLSARDTYLGEDYNGGPGGVYQSRSNGEAWERIELPQTWNHWPSFSSVVVRHDKAVILAVALDPYVESAPPRPPGVPGVLISRNDGRDWDLLSHGLALPDEARIRLLGISRDGAVVALMYPKPDGPVWFPRNGARLAIYRSLSLFERLVGNYGVAY